MTLVNEKYFKKNTYNYKKAQLYTIYNIVTIAILILFCILDNYSTTNTDVDYTPIIVINVSVIFILYYYGNLGLCVNITSFGILFTLTKPILLTGGVSSQFLIWTMMPPICALAIGNLKKGVFWAIITIFHQIVIFILDTTPVNEFYQQVDKVSILINHILFFIVVLSTIFIYEHQRNQQQNVIKKQLDDLTEQSKVLIQKNVELERFAFVASHDLKTPLRNIISFSSLLNRKLKNTDDLSIKQYTTFIKDYAYHMSHIIENIINFVKLSNTEIENKGIVDLEDIKNTVIQSLKTNSIKKNVLINTEGVLPHVHGYKNQLEQLLQNLITNALTYNENPQPQITIGIGENNISGKYIYIKDNGIGISPQYQETVFEMFTRLNSLEKYTGSGLGLAICKKIVLQHGGHIWLESAKDVGTTVYFTLSTIQNPPLHFLETDKKTHNENASVEMRHLQH